MGKKDFIFDCETYRIGFVPGEGKDAKACVNPTPRLVCMAYQIDDGRPQVLKPFDAVPVWLAALRDPDYRLIGLNLAYDNLVMLRAAWEFYRVDAIEDLFKAYKGGRCSDVIIRQQLIDIATRGLWPSYSMKALASRFLEGREITGKDGDGWRLRYAELDPYDLDDWPKEAIDYAIQDVEVTAAIYELQKTPQTTRFNTKLAGAKGVENEAFQTFADFCLSLMSVSGMKVDLDQAKKIDKIFEAKEDSLREELRRAKIIRPNGKIDQNTLRMQFEIAAKSAGVNPMRTPTGRVATNKAARTWLEDNGVEDPIFNTYQNYNRIVKFRSTYMVPLLSAPPYSICTNFNVLVESGRTSSSKPNIQNIPKRGRQSDAVDVAEIRRCFVAREGNVFINSDYSTVEMRTLAQANLNLSREINAESPGSYIAEDRIEMVKALREGRDLHTEMAALLMPDKVEYEELIEILNDRNHRLYRQAKEMRDLSKCFHPDVEVLTKRGWVRIVDLKPGVEVAAAKCTQGLEPPKLVWETPSRLTYRKADKLIDISSQDMQLKVTPDHRIPNWTRSGYVYEGLAGGDFWSNDRIVQCAGVLGCGSEPLSKLEKSRLRLAVAIQADGTIRPRGHVMFGFSKNRKTKRLKKLAEAAEIPIYYARPRNNGSTAIKLHKEDIENSGVLEYLDGKTLSWSLLSLSLEDRLIVLDEVKFWDAHIIRGGRSYHYCSAIPKNINVLSALASTAGMKTSTVLKGEREDTFQSLAVKDRSTSRTAGYKVEEEEYDGNVYCLTVPSDAVLVRYRGATSIVHQCANFGYPGGLSAKTFVRYARNFGLRVDPYQSQNLRNLWLRRWPEMTDYFRFIARGRLYDDRFLVKQHGPNGQISPWRIRSCPTINSAYNTVFQGMAADGIKLAVMRICEAAYLDKNSPLYGFRLVAMIHDELLAEGPIDRASKALDEMKRIMEEAMGVFVPDIPIETDGMICRRWDIAGDSKRDPLTGEWEIFVSPQDR